MADTVLITTHDLEPAVRLREAFKEEDYRVELMTAGERIADVDDPVLLVLTGELGDKQARRLVKEARELDYFPIIGLVDSNDEANAATCRRYGLTECCAKPISLEEIVLVGRRLIQRRRLREVTGIVGETEAMREVLERVIQIAPVHSTVLVTGESGTGKELVARGIHALSARRHKPFIAANVAALPSTLLESELFGHEKGAFTGAVAQRKGLFELAHQGTLFLDEIGEMPLATQTNLLRVLEERQFMRVGGEDPFRTDVRVIAATNQELRHSVELGDFRRDLYYRLNVLHIELPPLRKRREDIPRLVEAFTRQFSREHDMPRVSLSDEAMRILVEYDWPGNVRELRNLMESMIVLAPGRVITPDDIPPHVRSGTGAGALLPAPVRRARPRRGDEGGDDADDRSRGGPPAELEFLFRTLLELRMDVEDLRREFDEYRRSHPEIAEQRGPLALSAYGFGSSGAMGRPEPAIEDAEVQDDDDGETRSREADAEAEGGTVVFRPGMTMSDLEREAIQAALRDVAGNRRKAAERLGIGERTLYRKIKEYEIPL